MKLSYQWLSEYVDVGDMSPEVLAEVLTRAGLEVDAIVPRNAGVRGVVVAEVVSFEPHPNADRLKVCQVNVGDSELRTIVCGAPNVVKGMKVPAALPGSVLPGGAIGVAKLRGIESQGMLCSAKEIGLETKLLPKEQTEGLYVLPSDAPVGEAITKYLGLDDVVIEIGLTPNRSDCLSLRGLAFEVAALLERPLRFPEHQDEVTGNGDCPVQVELDSLLCTRYDAQVLDGVGLHPSPIWMQMRLMAMGIRPINVVVDITNYVMLEWGQPLHAFDLNEVRGGTIVVRQGHDGETIVTLDGEERTLTEDTLVIADTERAIGIAGVMGGENSEISAGTQSVILESAAFNAISVRKTGQRLGLRSEAQQRFEKGVDPLAIRGALLRAGELLVRYAGGQYRGGVRSVLNPHVECSSISRTVAFRPNRCNGLLGTALSEDVMAEAFQRLGFSVTHQEDGLWKVHVPTRRPDIEREADLVEEVARLVGYDCIPTTLPQGATTVGGRNALQTFRKQTRSLLSSAGMNEVVTYSLTYPSKLDLIRVETPSPYRNQIPLMHPMSEERTVLRTHLLPGLAETAIYNRSHGVVGGSLFETGKVYWPTSLPLEALPCERWQLGMLWFGQLEGTMGDRSRAIDFYDAKGAVERWLNGFGLLNETKFVSGATHWSHPGRTAEVVLRGERIGFLGELHPEVADALDLQRALYAEFDLETVVRLSTTTWKITKLPKYPASRRDLAVLVGNEVSVSNLLDEAHRVAGQFGSSLLEECRIFDIYTGKGVEPGKRSVAFAFTWRAEDRTLTDDEIVAVEQAILSAWEDSFGAILRSL